MTTNAETYSTGNGYPTKCDKCHISDPLAFLLVLESALPGRVLAVAFLAPLSTNCSSIINQL